MSKMIFLENDQKIGKITHPDRMWKMNKKWKNKAGEKEEG
jgi:hypothetical protein